MQIDQEFRSDCKVWLEFLKSDNTAQVMNRQMIDLFSKPTDSMDIGFYSDASAAKSLRFGAILQNHLIRGDRGSSFIETYQPSIEYLELFALCSGILTWQANDLLINKCILIHCDNISVVHMVNKLTSGCKNCMFLIRLLVLNRLKFNRRISAVYASSKDNFLSDALSWNQMDRFQRLGPHMNSHSDNIPDEIWPIPKIWVH